MNAFRQIGFRSGFQRTNGVTVIQRHTVDVNRVLWQFFDSYRLPASEEDFNIIKLPLIYAGFRIFRAGKREGGDLFIAMLDDVLFAAGQASGGFKIGDILWLNMLHVSGISFFALEKSVFYLGKRVDFGPIGFGKEIIKDFLTLIDRLGSLETNQPFAQSCGGIGQGQNKGEDRKSVDGIKRDGAFADMTPASSAYRCAARRIFSLVHTHSSLPGRTMKKVGMRLGSFCRSE